MPQFREMSDRKSGALERIIAYGMDAGGMHIMIQDNDGHGQSRRSSEQFLTAEVGEHHSPDSTILSELPKCSRHFGMTGMLRDKSKSGRARGLQRPLEH